MAKNTSKSLSRPRRVPLVNASAYSRQRSSMAAALPQTYLKPSRRSTYIEAPEIPFPSLDRRTYHPDPVPTYKRLSGRPARVVAAPPAKRAHAPAGTLPEPVEVSALLFKNPSGVKVCVQRGVRKEVMHALGVAGGPVRPGHKTAKSKIRC